MFHQPVHFTHTHAQRAVYCIWALLLVGGNRWNIREPFIAIKSIAPVLVIQQLLCLLNMSTYIIAVLEFWFVMSNYTAAISPSCNRKVIKNWKQGAGMGSWLNPIEWVAGSPVISHWNFPKAYFFLLAQQTLNQEVLKKAFLLWKSHIYF